MAGVVIAHPSSSDAGSAYSGLHSVTGSYVMSQSGALGVLSSAGRRWHPRPPLVIPMDRSRVLLGVPWGRRRPAGRLVSTPKLTDADCGGRYIVQTVIQYRLLCCLVCVERSDACRKKRPKIWRRMAYIDAIPMLYLGFIYPSAELSCLQVSYALHPLGGRGTGTGRGGELGALRVREHPLGAQVHPLIAKCTLSK